MWLSTMRLLSVSLMSGVETPRSEVPPRTMPSRRGIMWMNRLRCAGGMSTPPLVL